MRNKPSTYYFVSFRYKMYNFLGHKRKRHISECIYDEWADLIIKNALMTSLVFSVHRPTHIGPTLQMKWKKEVKNLYYSLLVCRLSFPFFIPSSHEFCAPKHHFHINFYHIRVSDGMYSSIRVQSPLERQTDRMRHTRCNAFYTLGHLYDDYL